MTMFLPAEVPCFLPWFQHAFSICVLGRIAEVYMIGSTVQTTNRSERHCPDEGPSIASYREILRCPCVEPVWFRHVHERPPHCFCARLLQPGQPTVHLPQIFDSTEYNSPVQQYNSTKVHRYKGWPGATFRQLTISLLRGCIQPADE